MSWHRLITHNLGWKLVSVLLATLIWFIADRAQDAAVTAADLRTFAYLPVLALKPANDSRVFRIQPATARVAVRGTTARLRQISSSEISVFVNLGSALAANAIRCPLEIRLPAGLSLASLQPREVDVEFSPGFIPAATNSSARPRGKP